MKLKNIRIDATTASDGTKTATAETVIYGQLFAVDWIDGTFDDGVDATLSVTHVASGTSRTLLTLTDANNDAFYYPRHVVHGETGTALTGTAGGDRVMPLIDGLLSLVIAQGGNAKTGGMIVHYFEGGC